MSYIKISNPAESVNRLFLEKLGLSTKRDNEETIGQFGSGTKFAPIAALRNGWEWITIGSDDRGPYRMDYVIIPEDGIDCIGFKYSDLDGNETIKESSFTAEAGTLSWNESFQIFREAFNNALDYKIEFGVDYSVEIVDKVEWEPGVFSVYLTAAPELVAIVDDLDNYFTVNRTPISESRYGKIYERHGDTGKIYHRGVLVHTIPEFEDREHLFDYELNNIELNEERNVRDQHNIGNNIAWCLSYIHDFDIEAIDIFVDNMYNKNIYEWNMSKYVMSYGSFFGSHIVDAYAEKYKTPNKPYFLDKEEAQHAPLLRAAKYSPVVLEGEGLVYIMKELQPRIEKVLGEDFKYNLITLTIVERKLFEEAYEIVKRYDPRIEDCEIAFFDNDDHGVLGIAILGTKKILLQRCCFDSGIPQLVATLIHELDHIVTGVMDADRQFRSIADQRIAELVMKLDAFIGDEIVEVGETDSLMEV